MMIMAKMDNKGAVFAGMGDSEGESKKLLAVSFIFMDGGKGIAWSQSDKEQFTRMAKKFLVLINRKFVNFGKAKVAKTKK